MERTAFARARRYLGYSPLAKWAALVAAVGTGILFVALLLVLGLFADLMVERGEIPAYANLGGSRRADFRDSHAPASFDLHLTTAKAEAEQIWKHGRAIVDGDEVESTLRISLRWFADVYQQLKTRVSDQAAEQMRLGLEQNIKRHGLAVALNRNIEDMGILPLVIRDRSGVAGWLVDTIVRTSDWTWDRGNQVYLQGLFVLALGLALIRAVLTFTASYMAAVATIEAATRLRRAVYHHTYRLGTLAFRALGPSEAVSVTTRHLEAVHDGLYAWLTVVFREPVKFGLLLVFALLVDFWLALAFLVFAILVWLIGGQIAAYFRRRGRFAAHRAAEQLVLVQESLMLMRLVKVYLMELFNQARVERQLATYADAQHRRYRGEAIYRPILASLGLLAALILLFVAGQVVVDGELSVTTAMVLITALVSMYWPLTTWLDHRKFIRRGRRSAAVLFEFLDRSGGVGQVVEAEFLAPMSKQLEFDDVSLQEPGVGRKLLDDISLVVQAGQRVALVGPNDLEKHALVYLIPRFLDPTSGEIRIDRRNLRWVTLDSLRAQTALVMQHNLVFNDTVGNNIGCGDPSYKLPKIIEAAKIAHAHQFIQKLPQGYETPIGEMGYPLNLGEKFRIALARAILREPAMMVIEEPFEQLDDDTKALIDDTFARVLPGRTVIFLPHRLSTIRSCDKVFLLYNGRIEGAGEHRELLAKNELYRHLQYLEFNEFATSVPASMPVTADQEL